jgi:hypothetical protein
MDDTIDTIVEEPIEEQPDEKKKKKRGRTIAIIGVGALILAAGGCCIGTGYINDFLPKPTEAVPVVVEEIEEEIEEIVDPVAPIEPVTPIDPVNPREAWYGSFEGVAHGIRTSLYEGNTNAYDFANHGNTLWLEILDQEYCYGLGFCNNDRSWGLDLSLIGCTNGEDFTLIRIFLPDDLSEAEGFTLTDSKLNISPTEGHPYAVVIDLESGHIEGYLETDGIVVPGAAGEAVEWYVVDSLEADISAEDYPCQR